MRLRRKTLESLRMISGWTINNGNDTVARARINSFQGDSVSGYTGCCQTTHNNANSPDSTSLYRESNDLSRQTEPRISLRVYPQRTQINIQQRNTNTIPNIQGTSSACKSLTKQPRVLHEIKNGIDAIDPSSGWILQAVVNVENVTEQSLVAQALDEMKQLRLDLAQNLGVELEVVDRMLLDTRTRVPGQPWLQIDYMFCMIDEVSCEWYG